MEPMEPPLDPPLIGHSQVALSVLLASSTSTESRQMNCQVNLVQVAFKPSSRSRDNGINFTPALRACF